MKAKEAVKEVRRRMEERNEKGIRAEWKVFGEVLREKVENQLQMRTRGDPSRSAVEGSVKELETWTRKANESFGWFEPLRKLFLVQQKREIYYKYGYLPPDSESLIAKAEKVLEQKCGLPLSTWRN